MPLTFGIPTLDELLEIPASRERPANRGARTSEDAKNKEEGRKKTAQVDTTSMALLGPDGSGKTVLALHVASQYRAFCASKLPEGTALPIIVYVSSDLQFESARTVWDNFELDEPNGRQIPFQRMPEEIRRREQNTLRIALLQLVPGAEGDKSEVAFLLNRRSAGSRGDTTVGFLDLARFTAGDDWNFVNSLIVNLEAIELPTYKDDRRQKRQLSHLVIIDSVAGFETFMGKLDAYGMEQTRRARIAQCMRNADTHVHLVFCVEEPDEGKRLPEEYVTDVVVRLRSRREGGRSLRTVEVEKARARNHAVGEHVFEIRSHRGSSTGAWENPDTPAVRNAYVHVFHSLSHRNLLVAADRGPGRPEVPAKEKAAAPFGLHYLDRLLESGHPVGDPVNNQPVWGLRAGSTAAIIGDTGTGKSSLAEKFLAEGFCQLVQDALAIFVLAFEPDSLRQTGKKAIEARERIGRRLSQSVVGSRIGTGEKSDLSEEILADLSRLWQVGATASEQALKENASFRFPESVLVNVGKRRSVLQARGLSAPPKLYVQAKSRSTCHADFRAFSEYSNKNVLTDNEKQECLIQLFRHPNLRAPAILLTTADRNVSVLVDRCLGYLQHHIEECLDEYLERYDHTRHKNIVKAALNAIKQILEEQIIVRRFDIDSVTSAQLFDVVQRNIVEAHYLLHGEYFPPDTNQRFRKGDRIRLVIDDVRVLSNLCPSVSSDSAFLPFLVFYLQREGVTTLMVHTDDLRPGIRPVDPISLELHSLLSQIILTWSVPFQGKTRVAITAIPATSRDTNGIVREVEAGWIPYGAYGCLTRVVKAELPKVDVTPKFELYSDLEIGKPQLIPLAVYLFAATEACRRYMDEEDLMYRQLFAAVDPSPGIRDGENGRVLWPVEASQHYSIRDLTHLPWDVHADHTIVDQIDGFWSLDAGTGALASQRDYLMSKESEIHEDPFNLFRGKPLHRDSDDTEIADEKALYTRNKFFQNSGYRSRIVDFVPTDDLMPDRVPFMWDFGFVMVPVGPWKQAAKREVKCDFIKDFVPKWYKPSATAPDPNVNAILDKLRKEKDQRTVVPWRLFLGACKEVADQSRQDRAIDPIPFDFASSSAETVASLFLEIWFSEIALALPKSKGPDQVGNWNKWLLRLSSKVYQPLKALEARDYSLAALLNPSHRDEVKRLGSVFREFRRDYIDKAMKWNAARGLNQQAVESPEQEKKAVADWEEATVRAKGPKGRKDREQRELCIRKLPAVALSLYKTWLLLLDVFDFASLLDPNSVFEIKQPKVPSRYSMAVRHDYRTACDHQAHTAEGETLPDGQYALAMPGLFSTRGDAFLATAQASRSRILASHAIDLLCSRRANLRRMQMGMGLPVRDVLKKEACRNMRTALRAVTRDESNFGNSKADAERSQETLMEVTYGELCGLGGEGIDPPQKGVPLRSFPSGSPDKWKSRWLFPNAVPEYDRVSRVFQKWLSRLCQWTVLYQARHTVGWAGGFVGYDALSEYRFAPLVTYDSFEYFADLCDYLVAELAAAERKTTS
jgi:KaiC/GvpD/RAD55 family RecA-like ATPase